MHVERAQADPELRAVWGVGRVVARVLASGWGPRLINALSRRALVGSNISGLDCAEEQVPRGDGSAIRVRIYRPQGAHGDLPVMLYLHGGGYIIGTPEEFATTIKKFIDASPCVVVAPDYRKSFAAPFPAAFDDCYATLRWAVDNAARFGGRSDRLIVGGHSAGGGLTAAVVQKATDTGDVSIAFQMPIYPMIDDRQTSASARDNDAPVWDAAANRRGWGAYLRGVVDVTAYAAAARAVDVSKLPPTITFVGDLDPFRDETQAYVDRLRAAGVPVTFTVVPGAFHGFEVLAPKTAIAARADAFLFDAFRAHVAAHFGPRAPHAG